MSKRFKLFTGNNYGVQSVDGEVFIDSIVSIGDADVLVDLLNDLTEENEQLKQQIYEIKKILLELNNLECFWDSAILQEVIENISNVVGVDLE